jgi:hypothetical protein
MQLSRRGLIVGGIVAASGLTAAQAAVKVPSLRNVVLPAPLPDNLPLPVLVDVNPIIVDPGHQIRPEALKAALAALDRHKDRIENRDRIYVVDFQAHSSRPRMFEVDMATGAVKAFRTAHGKGSDPGHTGFASQFSNIPDSYASSVGAYVTAGMAMGAKHGPNVLLEGLEWSNNEARDREIIVHSADYCEIDYLIQFGKLGRSYGCFSVSRADLTTLRPAMDGGRLLFAAA